jgi:glucosamine 6-phosphate synthetase-like amidotransferase/phosphosugar isomerase protein|tara:strand:- start:2296 stop:3228 length:933 start_codon:yes stop_codon:yes gene_type:complete
MCGLVGYIGKEKMSSIDLFHLLLENDSRGGHSTGFYNGDEFYKCVGNSENLFQDIRKYNSNFIIGHTRYATHGAHTLDNQHPYVYGNIVGAHNGVVGNYLEVGDKYGLEATTVDSQMIFKVLNHTNDVQTLGLFSGTLATIFTKSDGTLCAYRKGNPLFVGQNPSGTYFSSIKSSLEDLECDSIWQLKEGKLYTFNDKGTVSNKIDIKHKPIASAVTFNSDWKSYGKTTSPNLFSRAVKSCEIDTYNNSYSYADTSYSDSLYEDETYLEVLAERLFDIVTKHQSKFSQDELHILEETLQYVQDNAWEFYR